ncbi:MAG: 16S rRNA (guanine(527)-N(7))-methyltransferase RsmG [Pseudomonadota bacterium]|nr:16S rRNA (guanine(527)-N(7))-methyltransferase RsmG [Pseudomonadota bacterium]
MSEALESTLRRGLDALRLKLGDLQIGRLLEYLDLIGKWNRVYNLTAVRDIPGMLTHHLLDSLAVVAPLLRQAGGAPLRLLDVGSGAGLPGVVISICCPMVDVDCVDTVAKKAAFIRQVAATLQLPNLHAIHGRVEKIARKYDVAASRAFASLAEFVVLSEGAVALDGVWMAQKGREPLDEIAAVPAGWVVFHVEQLQVPGLDAERCIVWLRRAATVT